MLKRKQLIIFCLSIWSFVFAELKIGYIDSNEIMSSFEEVKQVKVDLEKVQIFWEELGSNVVLLDPKKHDSILAKTSHLPHAIAYALMDFLFNNFDRDTFNYSGGRLEDYTRIASSN